MSRCIALINQTALLKNIAYLKTLCRGADIVLMIKANAYGHGLAEVAAIIADEQLSLGVATIEEAISLRAAEIKHKIYLFDGGASRERYVDSIEHRIIPMITDRESAELWAQASRSSPHGANECHIKIDSGFTRLGFDHRSMSAGHYDDILLRLEKDNKVHIGGIATHFCSADVDEEYTKEQMANFKRCLDRLDSLGISNKKIHMANSAAILRKNICLPGYDRVMVRPGIAAYGLDPFSRKKHPSLEPVMSVKARILTIKTIEEGQGVGYGRNFIAKRLTTVAIVAIGYGDGLPRRFSRRGYFLAKGQRAPLIGNISMDSCAIDISDIEHKLGRGALKPGDMVTVLGRDEQELTAYQLGLMCDTIPYEITTAFSGRMSRQVLRREAGDIDQPAIVT